MTNSLLLPEVQNVLERLHSLADDRDEAIVQQVRHDEAAWNAATSEQKAALMAEALLPVSKDAGRFLYAVARSISANRTCHLMAKAAAAVLEAVAEPTH